MYRTGVRNGEQTLTLLCGQIFFETHAANKFAHALFGFKLNADTDLAGLPALALSIHTKGNRCAGCQRRRQQFVRGRRTVAPTLIDGLVGKKCLIANAHAHAVLIGFARRLQGYLIAHVPASSRLLAASRDLREAADAPDFALYATSRDPFLQGWLRLFYLNWRPKKYPRRTRITPGQTGKSVKGGTKLYYTATEADDIAIDGGVITLTIPVETTSTFSFSNGVYDLVVTMLDDKATVILEGKVSINDGVTR